MSLINSICNKNNPGSKKKPPKIPKPGYTSSEREETVKIFLLRAYSFIMAKNPKRCVCVGMLINQLDNMLLSNEYFFLFWSISSGETPRRGILKQS